MLARETLTRSSLETQKLELMSEVSNLKLRQAAIDRENMDLRKRLTKTLDLSTAATAALTAAANAAAASRQNQHMGNPTGSIKNKFITLLTRGGRIMIDYWLDFVVCDKTKATFIFR